MKASGGPLDASDGALDRSNDSSEASKVSSDVTNVPLDPSSAPSEACNAPSERSNAPSEPSNEPLKPSELPWDRIFTAASSSRSYLQAIQTDLRREGHEVEIKANDKRTVHSALIRFPGLLFDLGLSPHGNEVFSIKIEVDTKPPAGDRALPPHRVARERGSRCARRRAASLS